MTRPADWWVLDLDRDPTPGSPDNLTRLGDRFLDFADVAHRAQRAVESLQGDGAVLSWVGQSGDAFREQFGEFPTQVRKLHTSHQMVGDALHDLAPKLQTAQAQADRALADGRAARERLSSLTGQLDLAQGDVEAITRQAEQAGNEPTPDPDQVRQAVRDAEAAKRRLATAQGQVASAEQELQAAKTLAEQARQMRDAAAQECEREIHEASEVGIQPRSFWQKLGDAFKAIWDIICEVAKWVALVAGVIALIIGGPLAWVALAAGAVLLVKAIVDFAQGKGSVMDLVFGILGVIPGVRGLTSLSKLSSLYKAGGLKEIGKAAFTSMKDVTRNLVDLVKNVGKGAVTVVKTGFGNVLGKINNLPIFTSKRSFEIPACGDPVDVTTGRMFLTDVDANLPGPAPLLLERTHRSDYRTGRLFGRSWASTLDQRIEIEPDAVHFLAADGTLFSYPVPGPQGPVFPVHGRAVPLRRAGDGGFLVTDPGTGQALIFTATPPRSDAETSGPAGAGDPAGSTPEHDPLAVPAMPAELVPSRRTVTRPPAALLTAIVDSTGHRVEIHRDETGLPVQVSDSAGRRIAVETTDGLVTALRLVRADDVELARAPGNGTGAARYDPDPGPLVTFRYADRRLVEVVNTADQPMRFDYDDAGRITRWEDRNGMWYRYSYDEAGRCVLAEGRDAYLTYRFAYDPDQGVTRATNSLGHTTVFQLNDVLQVVGETDPLGNTVRSEWDSQHRLLSRTDPLGRTTRFRYAADGTLESVIRPDGSHAEVFADADGVAAIVVEVDGVLWWRHYGPRERIDPFTEPLGVNRPVSGPEETRAQASPPDGLAEGWTVDGELAWRADPAGGREEWHYDGEGNEIAHVDPIGRTTRTVYDHFDLPVATITPSGARTTYGYDTELRLTSVTNPDGLVWRYTYDPAGRLITETDFDGRVRRVEYDPAGRPVRVVNGAGEVVEFGYDLLGNVVERRVATAAPTTVTRFAHDPVGRIVTATGPDATLTIDRDFLGRLTAETVNGRTVSYDYDDVAGTVRRRTPGGAETVWHVDETGRPLKLEVAGHVLARTHDVAGRSAGWRLDGGLALVETFDAADRLTGQRVTGPAGAGPRREFTYRPGGDLTEVDAQQGPRRFQLDADGRVTAVEGPDWSERYRYDQSGVITHAVWPADAADHHLGGTCGARAYQGTDLVRAGAARYGYDAQGRLICRRQPDPAGGLRIWTYQWDAEDRLTGVTTPEGDRWRYRYDPLGRRIAKQRLARAPDDTVVEQIDFRWDGPVLIEEADAGGRLTTWEYDLGGRRPLTQIEYTDAADAAGPSAAGPAARACRVRLIVTDQVGTPTELLDLDGSVTWRSRAGLWGQRLDPADVSAGTPLRFPGQYLDAETGLHYNVFRYYDPSTARYLSQDPLGLAPAPSPVRYVDNPHRQIDPLGLARVCSGKGAGKGAGKGGRGNRRFQVPNIPTVVLTKFADIKRAIQLKSRAVLPARNFAGELPQHHQLTFNKNGYGGSRPDKKHCWSVDMLNFNANQGRQSQQLLDAFQTAGIGPQEKWIKGHLFNDNLGGPGITENLTPLTNKANRNFSGSFEEHVKNAVTVRFRQLDELYGIKGLGVDFKVEVSPTYKFPNATDRGEGAIRDYLEINAKYTGLDNVPADRQYLINLPELPPLGTRMDTISGAFTTPDGSPWPRSRR